MRSLAALLLAALLLDTAPLFAANDEATIDYLLKAVGSSECVFVRNGGRHDAKAAEAHLRMKYRRGKRWVSDAETFIDRIATKSSFSGKPYLIACPGAETVRTASWLRNALAAYSDAAEQPGD